MTNWEHYRGLYPVVNKQTYFMTAGAGAISLPVLQAIQNRYQAVAEHGGRAFGENIGIMESCREKIAQLINAEKEHIAFIPNVSFGMNALAHSLTKSGSILLAKNDFASSIIPWKNAGHAIKWAATSADLPTELANNTGDQISSVVASFVHFGNGYKLDLAKLKQLNPDANIIVNATQAIGAFPIDVKDQNIDALLCSCYKWMGCGEGLAFMYINPSLFKKLNPAFVGWRSVQSAMSFDGQSQFYNSARVFELGWDNMTSFAGFNTALDLIAEIGVANIAARIEVLTEYLISGLQKLNIPILSNLELQHRSGILLLGPFPNLAELMQLLEKNNIWATQRDGGIRISIHYYNNELDINNLLNVFG